MNDRPVPSRPANRRTTRRSRTGPPLRLVHSDRVPPSPDVELEGRELVRALRAAAEDHGRWAVYHRDRAADHARQWDELLRRADTVEAVIEA